MNITNQPHPINARYTHPAVDPSSFLPREENHYAEIDQQQQTIEHLTVPGFMRMISKHWHIDDITRFGDKVGKAANALQMSYLVTFDVSLGVLRTFPVPFLARIYKVMQKQYKWPEIIEIKPDALEDGRREADATLKGHKRAVEHLRHCFEAAANPQVKRSFGTSIEWLDKEIARLDAQLAAAPNAVSAAEEQPANDSPN